jgi:uncharacterized protein YbjT (DUF2867 family)
MTTTLVVGGTGKTGPVARGVRHLVLLCGRGEEAAEVCERIVRDVGTGWTILRCGWFAQNFSEHFLLDRVLGGEILLPAGTGRPATDFAAFAREAAAAGVWAR